MTTTAHTTRLGRAVVPEDDQALTERNVTSYRAASTHLATSERLGPLQDLPGFWEGVGFNLIARPDFSSGNKNGIFLELNILRESLEFTPIGSPVMNRGSQQEDIAIYGLTYLHRVTDALTGGALHIEPGTWLTIPKTTVPKSPASIARLLTIPHGNAICTYGHSENVVFQGLPEIPPANTVPFIIGSNTPAAGTGNPYPEFDLSRPSDFRTNPLHSQITQAFVNDPNEMLRQALQGQHLTKIIRLITNTAEINGTCNIPFIEKNADSPSLESVFAIETVENPDGGEFLQLQYSQTAILNFRGMSFPHVTVGTLIKAF